MFPSDPTALELQKCLCTYEYTAERPEREIDEYDIPYAAFCSLSTPAPESGITKAHRWRQHFALGAFFFPELNTIYGVILYPPGWRYDASVLIWTTFTNPTGTARRMTRAGTAVCPSYKLIAW